MYIHVHLYMVPFHACKLRIRTYILVLICRLRLTIVSRLAKNNNFTKQKYVNMHRVKYMQGYN